MEDLGLGLGLGLGLWAPREDRHSLTLLRIIQTSDAVLHRAQDTDRRWAAIKMTASARQGGV